MTNQHEGAAFLLLQSSTAPTKRSTYHDASPPQISLLSASAIQLRLRIAAVTHKQKQDHMSRALVLLLSFAYRKGFVAFGGFEILTLCSSCWPRHRRPQRSCVFSVAQTLRHFRQLPSTPLVPCPNTTLPPPSPHHTPVLSSRKISVKKRT
uniref:Uncharacterized protein n=1 Tax=Mycena chlorophos TaxID=658473 RepID=A0ABQ0L4V7_MYCCL|nr:predicted protein [Mycena chlorophos]